MGILYFYFFSLLHCCVCWLSVWWLHCYTYLIYLIYSYSAYIYSFDARLLPARWFGKAAGSQGAGAFVAVETEVGNACHRKAVPRYRARGEKRREGNQGVRKKRGRQIRENARERGGQQQKRTGEAVREPSQTTLHV